MGYGSARARVRKFQTVDPKNPTVSRTIVRVTDGPGAVAFARNIRAWTALAVGTWFRKLMALQASSQKESG
jgi:hypothetical protein